MIRYLLLALSFLGLVRGEEQSLADFIPELGSEEFKVRQAAMEKIHAYTKANPKKILKEIPPLLKKIDNPEARLRLRKIAEDLIKIKTAKARFGFLFSLHRTSTYKKAPVIGISLSFIMPGSPAQRGGLRVRDTILALDGKPFPRNLSEDEIREIFADQDPEKQITLAVLRQNKVIKLKVSPQMVPLEPEILEHRQLLFKDWLYRDTKE